MTIKKVKQYLCNISIHRSYITINTIHLLHYILIQITYFLEEDVLVLYNIFSLVAVCR